MDRLRFKRDCRQFLLFPGAAEANSTPGAVSFTKDLSSSKSIQHKISDSVKKRFEKMIKSRFLSNLKRKPIRKSGQRSRKNAKSQSLSAAKPNIKSGQPSFLL